MIYFLAVQSTYTAIEVGVFAQEKLLAFALEDKIRASKNLVPLIAYTLEQAGITLEQLSFIAVNQGPGPFTTLRVAIATVNGLAFASQLPLIGIDALDAFLQEYTATPSSAKADSSTQATLVLFNAFNNDVYYALKRPSFQISKGYKNIDVLLEHIQQELAGQSLICLGNGTALHQEKIRQLFGTQASIPQPLPSQNSLQQLGLLALEKWSKKDGLIRQLMPLYLKQAL